MLFSHGYSYTHTLFQVYVCIVELSKTFKRLLLIIIVIMYNSVDVQENHNYYGESSFVDFKRRHLYMRTIALKFNFYFGN